MPGGEGDVGRGMGEKGRGRRNRVEGDEVVEGGGEDSGERGKQRSGG